MLFHSINIPFLKAQYQKKKIKEGKENNENLATPFKPVEKYGMASTAFAAMIATESDGVTKNLQNNKHVTIPRLVDEKFCKKKPRRHYLFPRIILRSASPSAAAPNSGGSTSELDLPNPMRATNSFA